MPLNARLALTLPTTTALLPGPAEALISTPLPTRTEPSRLAPGSVQRPPDRPPAPLQQSSQCKSRYSSLEKPPAQPRPTHMPTPRANKAHDQTLLLPCPHPLHPGHWSLPEQTTCPSPCAAFESQSKLAASVVRSFQAILVIPTTSCLAHRTLPQATLWVSRLTCQSGHAFYLFGSLL